MAVQSQSGAEEVTTNSALPLNGGVDSKAKSKNDRIIDLELDDVDDTETDDEHMSASRNRQFQDRSAVRRRLEDRLEIKRLREQLGIDDFDF